jgi:hypothetical protein
VPQKICARRNTRDVWRLRLGIFSQCPIRNPEHLLSMPKGASLNAQSQAPDIPGVSSRADFLRHTLSLQAQSKAPDIFSLSAYSEQLLGSLNAQDQAPDDPLSLRAYIEMLWVSFHAQDRQCDPYIFVENFRHCRQDPYLWIPVVRQGVVCFHSGGLGYSWIFTVIVFNDPCGSSLFVSMYISLVFSLRRSA